MHMHRLERIWLMIGSGALVVFLLVIGVNAFAMGHTPPSDRDILDPTKVDLTEPFDKPGLKKIGEKRI